MDPAIASIVVAIIGLFGSVAVVAIKEFKDMKNKNSADHGAVMLKLNKVQDTVEKVGDRLNKHIDTHQKN
jgi:hypothetical protein